MQRPSAPCSGRPHIEAFCKKIRSVFVSFVTFCEDSSLMIFNGLCRPMALIGLGFCLAAVAEAGTPVRLYVRAVPITIFGKTGEVIAIEQENGAMGLHIKESDGFNVDVVNQLKEPTSIHWHGLILPALMDGVPFVSQDPIPPGGTYHYEFPLKQSGTYWLHSHYGLQEQQLASAPLILESEEQNAKADEQYTVLLSDYSFTSPAKILNRLKRGMQGMKDMKGMKGMKGMQGMKPMKGMKSMKDMSMAKMPATQKLFAQKWDGTGFVRVVTEGGLPDTDVKYDALIANRRTIDDPEVFRVKPGHTVLLRIIAGSAATNFLVNTGALTSQLTAVDGKDIEAVSGTYFQLGIAQRIDLLMKIPDQGGVFPILAQGEGTKQQCGVVLATEGEKSRKIPLEAELATAGLDNTQELRLKTKDPLPDKPVDRSLSCILGGDMAKYSWTINGAAYPNWNSLDVKENERVEIVFRNDTGMTHPMHLHGHDFEVTEIDGTEVQGALRDTLIVPPKSTIKVIFDANNPGVWAFHCHILYHAAVGMFTVLKYDGADTKFWQPEKTLTELSGSR
jgi:FtsP/CotA-like multicopper oxidase with cupredoxin domain